MKNIVHSTSVVILLLITKSFLFAQNGPSKQWDKTLGGNFDDELLSLQQTADGGYILGGFSRSSLSGDKSQPNQGPVNSQDFWVVKLDSNGNKTWDRTFGGTGFDGINSLQQTTDGGYILGGTSNSGITGDKSQASNGLDDFWVIKIDANGNKLWDKSFGGDNYDYLRSLQQTSDGGYLLGGCSYSSISGDKSQASKGSGDYWIVKIDASGNKLWDKTFGGSEFDNLTSLKQTIDGGYILGGGSYSNISSDKSQNSKGLMDYWVIRLDANGNKLWDKTIGGSLSEVVTSLQQTFEGGYILGGFSDSYASGDKSENTKGNSDYWVVKLDTFGNIQWEKDYGGDQRDLFYSLQQTSDWGYLLGGWSGSGISGDKTQPSVGGLIDYWIVKLDVNGNKMWDKTLGGTATDWLTSVQQTVDGGYMLGGHSGSTVSGDKSQGNQGGFDYWVIKLGPNCPDLTASLAASCSNGGTTVNVNISGMQPGSNNIPSWSLIYTVNGVSQTVTGTTPYITLQQNASPGTVYSLVHITSGSCTTNLTSTFTVQPVPSVPAVNAGSNCGPGSVLLSASGAPSSGSYVWYTTPTGGIPIQIDTTGTFNTPSLSINTTYYVAAANNAGCEGVRTPVVATIEPLPIVNVGPPDTICEIAPSYQITGFSPAGGIWSGPGVSSTGLFTPNNSLLGNQTITYTVTQNGCINSATKIVTVTPTPVVYAGFSDNICANGSPYQLSGFSPAGGIWSGPGVSINGLFTPSISLIGNQTLTYSVTQGGCTISSTKIVTVKPLPNVITGPAQTICGNALPIQLTGFSPAGGIWSGPGVSTTGLFTPSNSLVGSNTLTYSVFQNGCNNSATKVITVNAAPLVDAGPNEIVCADAAPFQLTGFSPAGGTWTGPGVSSLGLFTPSASLSGTQNLSYSVSLNGCDASALKQILIPSPIQRPVILQHSSDTLIASVNGSGYEWRLNNVVLPVTTKKLKVTATGVYKVRVEDNYNCYSEFSGDFNYSISGLGDLSQGSIKIYPNPSAGLVNVELQSTLPTRVTVLNLLGQEILNRAIMSSEETITLDLSQAAKGVYFIRIRNSHYSAVKKVILE